MKPAVSKWLEVIVLSVNCILISYALSNLSMLLRTHPLFILFFASEVWMTALYWEQVRKKAGCKVLAAALTVLRKWKPSPVWVMLGCGAVGGTWLCKCVVIMAGDWA